MTHRVQFNKAPLESEKRGRGEEAGGRRRGWYIEGKFKKSRGAEPSGNGAGVGAHTVPPRWSQWALAPRHEMLACIAVDT